ncbi:NADPH-dependent ferric siderophore reductase [Nocardiopsis sp. Huas11]|uniref:siderophore-interacting protein n=1 Tax=Nocardiopsis sp. Huas11 TaxID=2183912 RepID=UPI000F17450D|nr:siderophore-interacting protein [Nocardiopsis sp. Huas11]RKS08780.1 NADPH-dependent ferric siderophore reductase [Nocardiopsis sp. Huas11]
MSQELPVRYLRVASSRRLTPRMVRVTFTGDDLAGAALSGPDRQVKLYFPRPGQERPLLPRPEGDVMGWYEAYNAIPEDERPWMRSFTVRGHDPERGTLDIDFVVHGDSGPATRWAQDVRPGAVLGMFGPSDMFAVPFDLAGPDHVVLLGDESALPAVGTLLEALPEGTAATAVIEIADAAEEQPLPDRDRVDVRWVHRDGAAHGHRLLERVHAMDLPTERVGVWIAGEAGMVRSLRRHMVGDRGIGKAAIDFTGYWRRALTQDDAPTSEDMADAQELLARAQADGGGRQG